MNLQRPCDEVESLVLRGGLDPVADTESRGGFERELGFHRREDVDLHQVGNDLERFRV